MNNIEKIGFIRKVKGITPYYTRNNAFYALKIHPKDRAPAAKPEWQEVYNEYEDKFEMRQCNLAWEKKQKNKIELTPEDIERKSWDNTKRKIRDLIIQSYTPKARFITITIQGNIEDKIFCKLIQKFGAYIKSLGGGLLGVYERHGEKKGFSLHLHGMIICDNFIKENSSYICKKGRVKFFTNKEQAQAIQKDKTKGLYLYGHEDSKQGTKLRDVWRKIIKQSGLKVSGTVQIKEIITDNAMGVASYMYKYLKKDLEGLNKFNTWKHKFRYFRTKDFFKEPEIEFVEATIQHYQRVRYCKYGSLVVKKDDIKGKKWFNNELIQNIIDKHTNRLKQEINDILNKNNNIPTLITYGNKQVKGFAQNEINYFEIFKALDTEEQNKILTKYLELRQKERTAAAGEGVNPCPCGGGGERLNE